MQKKAYKLNQKSWAVVYLAIDSIYNGWRDKTNQYSFFDLDQRDIDRDSVLFRLCLCIVPYHHNQNIIISPYFHVIACMNSESMWIHRLAAL